MLNIISDMRALSRHSSGRGGRRHISHQFTLQFSWQLTWWMVETYMKDAPKLTIELESARLEDVGPLCQLINIAYRGEQGWTRETDIVAGERITTEAVRALLDDPSAHMLVVRSGNGLDACICVEQYGGAAHIGTFAVAPGLQGQGLGSQVLELAERFALALPGIERLRMLVVSPREELIAYYLRRGYIKTGHTQDYPVHLNVGVPRVDGLTVEYLDKCARTGGASE